MTRVAEVIVDVATMQTDIPYTYVIPVAMDTLIQPGMRVEVPFGNGNRHVQGFVIAVHIEEDTAAMDNLKEIIAPLDLAPILNTEMLQLAQYMRQQTYSFLITCLQTMLPSVMRASYEKWIVLIDEVPEKIHLEVFHEQTEINWKIAEAQGDLPLLMQLRAAGKVEIRYQVNQRNKRKTLAAVQPCLSFEQMEEIKVGLRKNAVQQRKLLSVIQSLEPRLYPIKEIMTTYDISRSVITNAGKSGWLELGEIEVQRDPYAGQTFNKSYPLPLNQEQSLAYQAITTKMKQSKAQTFLLEGITGSGKTEIYLQTIAQAIEKGQTAILLVPEISLTPQIVTRFKNRFGDLVAVLHSGLSEGEKYDEWRKIERKEAQIVVGARSAIFAPLENIGLIIVDEEHEASYKQDENPRYHARDIARWRSEYHHCPLVLGSATPSLESRARAQKERYQLLQLTSRAVSSAQLPQVEVVDMRQEQYQDKYQTFSQTLRTKIATRLASGEQSVLMLNRRGFSSFVMCRDCGYVLPCPNCDISLTLHMDTKTMKCHYCGHQEAIPNQCPICRGKKIRYYGTGTQKVESELQELFPSARIIRMDVDTTRRKGAHEKLLASFGAGEADILLGTQMIAKGLDFPTVTLVGVLNADTALNLPDFRSSEKTFQLLTQVSGRAGRGERAGEVIIQTFNPHHYAIQLAKEQDYEQFYQHEMLIRHRSHYPPYYYTVQLVASSPSENQVAKKMYQIVADLKQVLSTNSIILGPTPRAILRVNNRYYYQVVIKYKHEPNLPQALQQIMIQSQKDLRQDLKVSIDMEPLHFI